MEIIHHNEIYFQNEKKLLLLKKFKNVKTIIIENNMIKINNFRFLD